MTEDEMVRLHYQLSGHEFEQTPGDGEGQGSLARCSPWGRKLGHDLATNQQQQQINFSLVMRVLDGILPLEGFIICIEHLFTAAAFTCDPSWNSGELTAASPSALAASAVTFVLWRQLLQPHEPSLLLHTFLLQFPHLSAFAELGRAGALLCIRLWFPGMWLV